MADVNVYHIDETYVRIEADGPILLELRQHFEFFAKNYFFHPKYKAGIWNGKVSQFNMREKKLLKGLLPDLVTWCEYNSYSYALSDRVQEGFSEYNITAEKVLEFYQKIKGPFVPHEAQVNTLVHAVNNGRCIILAPTSNGKSYSIHGIAAFHALQKQRVLVIIDRSQLVEQLRKNLAEEYEGGKILKYNTVYDKIDTNKIDADIYFTTWQSCYQNDEKWFKQFDVILGDEVHKFKAASLKTILEKCSHIRYRYGFTATLDNDSLTDRLTLKGLFGTPHRVATIKESIEQGISARPTVYAIVLEYSDELRRKLANGKYKSPKDKFSKEIELIENFDLRNKFIASLRRNIKGNTLIAFKNDNHGRKILEAIGGEAFFINYTVDLDDRIDYSEQIDKMDDATAVVSIGTFSTGINIKRVNNIVIACQLQSKITVPQLIGRGMRVTEDKKTFDVYDIGDNLSWNGKDNYSYKHFKERLQMYAAEGFEIKIKTIKLV